MITAMEQAKAVADAVLYEGYLLYPYRASAVKNQVRWQWGVLMPPAFAGRDSGEHSGSHAELLAEPRPGAKLHVRLRFLQLQFRAVEGATGERFTALTIAGTEYTSFDEAVEREVDAVVGFDLLRAGEQVIPFQVDGGQDVQYLPEGARLLRSRQPLRGELVLRARPLPGPFGGMHLVLEVRNTSTWDVPGVGRQEALPQALIAAHTLLGLTGGTFLSLLDPPEWAAPAARECRNERVWPVLIGDENQRDTVLCSPIILYDYPSIAEQSPGDLFDGTEIDEILTLRTMTLTDAEKREARATDPRAADLLDRVDNLPPELLDRLHGTVRYLRSVTEPRPADPAEPPDVTARPDVPWWDPGADASMSPESDTVLINGKPVGKGTKVRLRPGKRADAHDMFVVGRTATVQAVLLDVDGDWHLAVTLDDDPGSDLYAAHGRYRYFATDEVEPL